MAAAELIGKIKVGRSDAVPGEMGRQVAASLAHALTRFAISQDSLERVGDGDRVLMIDEHAGTITEQLAGVGESGGDHRPTRGDGFDEYA